MACLAKCILQSLLSVFTAYQSHIRIKLAESLIRSKQETVQKDGKLSLIIDDLLSTRKEYRIHKLNVIVSILRYLMLTKALNLPGAQHMSRIFVSICGILSMSFMVFTLLLGNSVVKIESPKTEKNNLIN